MSAKQKAGDSSYYGLVTEPNEAWRRETKAVYNKMAIIANGIQFQRGIPVSSLENVDKGVATYVGCRPRDEITHWGLDKNNMKPIPIKAV